MFKSKTELLGHLIEFSVYKSMVLYTMIEIFFQKISQEDKGWQTNALLSFEQTKGRAKVKTTNIESWQVQKLFSG